MVEMQTSWQRAIASQERGGITGFAVCRGGALAFERVVVSAVVPSEGGVPVAQVECAVPRAQAIAAAVVIPCGAAAERGDDTTAAQVVPARANEVVARGWYRAIQVVSRRGSRWSKWFLGGRAAGGGRSD